MPEVTPTQEKEEQDEFDKTWNDNEDAGEKPEVTTTTPEDKVADVVPDKVVQPDKVEPKVEPVAPVVAPDEIKQLKEELAREKQRTASWDGRIQAANKRAEAAERAARELQDKPPVVKPVAAPVDADSDEEAAVQSFSNEFPDLPKPIIALVKKNMLPIVREMIKAERGNADPALLQEVQRLKKKVEVSDETTHYDAISKAHSDWKTIVSSGELDAFTASQPSYIRKALEEVRSSGDTEEVIDMFSQCKNWKQVNLKTKPIPPAATTNDDVKDMLAVTQSPGGPSKGKKVIDKDDFDGAWEEAEKSGG